MDNLGIVGGGGDRAGIPLNPASDADPSGPRRFRTALSDGQSRINTLAARDIGGSASVIFSEAATVAATLPLAPGEPHPIAPPRIQEYLDETDDILFIATWQNNVHGEIVEMQVPRSVMELVESTQTALDRNDARREQVVADTHAADAAREQYLQTAIDGLPDGFTRDPAGLNRFLVSVDTRRDAVTQQAVDRHLQRQAVAQADTGQHRGSAHPQSSAERAAIVDDLVGITHADRMIIEARNASVDAHIQANTLRAELGTVLAHSDALEAEFGRNVTEFSGGMAEYVPHGALPGENGRGPIDQLIHFDDPEDPGPFRGITLVELAPDENEIDDDTSI